MKKVLVAALLLISLAASAADGYVGWSELSFRSGPWNVRMTLSSDSSRLTELEISTGGAPIELPAAAIPSWGQPQLNGVKLLSVCCSDHVVLQIPLIKFDSSGHPTIRVWEVQISGGKYKNANWSQTSQLRSYES